ncbi:MAG: alkaline phosphatase D family protein [Thermocrispum sp.]
MPQTPNTSEPHPLRRRSVLRAGGAAGAAALVIPALTLPSADAADGYFQHGVASGDPLPDRVILWTRLTPSAAATPGSGHGPRATVMWQVARDAKFTQIAASGETVTGPERDHTVKIDAAGLAAGGRYFYRFGYRGTYSPVGRTRTAPAPSATPGRLRFGLVSCANWQSGHFASYRRLAERGDLDAVLHLGDYLYEYGPAEYGNFRPHDPPHEMTTLADYRRRHAQYKTDPSLRALHAECPWIVTWDDHETANDAWSGGAENHTDGAEGTWAQRRAWAKQAYREWMPIRLGPGGVIYRRLRFGTLAELTMLDLRSYRAQQVDFANAGKADDPEQVIAGAEQLAFLQESLRGSGSQWKLIGTSVMFSPLLIPPLPQIIGKPLSDLLGILPADGAPFNFDQWDGYQHERGQLVRLLRSERVRDTVFLTGDIHMSFAAEVPLDAGTYPFSPTVATEFVVTSVTSDNLDEIAGVPPRTASVAVETAAKALNRHLKFAEMDSHGYAVLDVTAERAQCDWYFLADREDANSPAAHAKSFATASGTQRLTAVAGPV